MKIQDYLDNLPKGEIVTNKRFLAVLKRKGLIYAYSPWGYLESARVNVADDGFHSLYELFPDGNAPKGTNSISFATWEEYEKSNIGRSITYNGIEFDTKYLDGCFQPYLVRVTPNTNVQQVHRRMSAWGQVG